jgi:CBS domain-containing protein
MYEFLDYHVEDVMTRDPITVAPATTLADAERIFEQHGFNALPVVGPRRQLQGWLTQLDLLRGFRFTEEHVFPPYEEIMRQPVSSVMSRDLRTVTPRAPLTRVLQKMLDARDKSLPVMDDGRLVGVVTRQDVLAALRRGVAGERPWLRAGAAARSGAGRAGRRAARGGKGKPRRG